MGYRIYSDRSSAGALLSFQCKMLLQEGDVANDSFKVAFSPVGPTEGAVKETAMI